VYTHLRNLKSQERILKVKNRYYIQTHVGDLLDFAQTIGSTGLSLTGIPTNERYFWEDDGQHENPDIHHYEKLASADGISKFCKKSDFSNEELIEKQLFDFASKIGAFLVYIFVEVMRPYGNDISNATKNEWSKTFLSRVISMESIFRWFQELLFDSGVVRKNVNGLDALLFDLGVVRKNVNRENTFYELERKEFEKLSRAFSKVYPLVFEILEKRWSDRIGDAVKSSGKDSCSHKWEQFYIPKFGKSYECGKCGRLAVSSGL
jgi:hypothetical protein